MKPLPKIAIIGAGGRWGSKILATLLKMETVCTVAAVTGSSQTERQEALKKFAPHVSIRTVDEILADPTIEAVFVATPIPSHFDLATRALESGKDVFLEKPCGNGPEETQKIVELAAKKKRIFQPGYILLHHPALNAILGEFNRRNEKIVNVLMTRLSEGTFDSPITWNLLSHDVSLALALYGSGLEFKLNGQTSVMKQGDPDIILSQFSVKGRTCGSSFINRVSKNKARNVTVLGEHGSTFVWDNDVLHEAKAGALVPVTLDTTSPLELECRAFLHSVTTREQPRIDGRIAIRVAEILHEAGA